MSGEGGEEDGTVLGSHDAQVFVPRREGNAGRVVNVVHEESRVAPTGVDQHGTCRKRSPSRACERTTGGHGRHLGHRVGRDVQELGEAGRDDPKVRVLVLGNVRAWL